MVFGVTGGPNWPSWGSGYFWPLTGGSSWPSWGSDDFWRLKGPAGGVKEMSFRISSFRKQISAHLYAFSPVRVIMCLFRSFARTNYFLHSEQVWVFSPLWVNLCLLNDPASPKGFLHSEQLWAFTPLWMIICLFKCLAWPKDFWHSEQTSITSWLSIWLAILLLSKSLELDWSGLGMLSTAQWFVLNWTYLNFPLETIATFSFSKFTFKWGLSGIFYDYKYL